MERDHCHYILVLFQISMSLVPFWQKIPTKTQVASNIDADKKYNLTVQEITAVWKPSLFNACALFVYLKGCTLYQFPVLHSHRCRLEASEVEGINYFIFLFIKLSISRETESEKERAREKTRVENCLELCPLNWILPGIICSSSSHTDRHQMKA